MRPYVPFLTRRSDGDRADRAMETVLTAVALAFVVATILLALWVFVIAPIVIPLRSARR